MAKNTDYDQWTLAELHEEAASRDISGRSSMDKAGLVKALKADDGKGGAGATAKQSPHVAGSKDPPDQHQPKDAAGADPRQLRPQKAPDPDKGDQPAAEPKDLTREGVGDWSSPAPGYTPPADRALGTVYDAEGNAIPRVVDQSYRVTKPAGEDESDKDRRKRRGQKARDKDDTQLPRRFKVRADVHGDVQPTWYILAYSREDAEAYYMEETGLAKKLERARKSMPDTPEPEMVTTELPD